ncbi:protein SMALL AUXIN UP-REGULATED RNA 12 [Andrographis paniculata]|uniref:protein SMALL AUXIN UP-REGULATED RNA 12 n=1 Tax=Andrographis paniculata TaxID=175694 RepID=UPI0021E72333|nr:protein SMALL AUXIN UP-REGULATED RNA 12 [Andrographis paniculata]
MFSKKFGSMKKLAKKVKSIGTNINSSTMEPPLLSNQESLLKVTGDYGGGATSTPTGTFPVYVGPDRQRFVVPTSYLSHPLFKMVLDKAHDEFGFHQRDGLVVPCSITAFREVVAAIECCNGQFDFGELVEEFL